ncbi:hypothetical protein RRG08_016030 [Elysia crispata]|uniref:Uncharacterized protein n=1 Tax=Elysia crispata TaxID=231223 RepID=A0AAE1B3G0_9GAST|nr:hypothetical protein RRG08_016030 [Elysia crispata]
MSITNSALELSLLLFVLLALTGSGSADDLCIFLWEVINNIFCTNGLDIACYIADFVMNLIDCPPLLGVRSPQWQFSST